MTASAEPSARIIVVAALASGLMLWAASPAVGAGWLAWVALVPVAAMVLASPAGGVARLAVPLAYVVYLELLVVPAFPFGLAEGQWGDPVIPVLVDDSPVLAIALVAVPLVGLLLYAFRFGQPWGAARLQGSLAIASAVAVPALAWTALDFARAKVDPGALWGPLFLSQADTPAGSLAALGGPWLITLAIVAVNYGVAAALVRRRPLPALAPVAGAIALALAGTAVEGRDAGAGELRVAAVQPGYDTAESERPELRHFAPGTYDLAALDVIRDLAELTRETTAAGAELVVWPEAAMYVDPRGEPPVRRALARLVRETGVPLVVPFFRPRPAGESQVVAVAPSPRGPRFTDVRPKQRPLWFIGERRAAAEEGPVAVHGREVGALLGIDAQDARNAASLAAHGAELLVSATHDWRQSAVPARAYARLASRASGVPLVRADWRYGSAIYGRDGAALDEVDGGLARATVVATVELTSSPAPYARIGDALGWLAIAAVALAALGWLASTVGRRRAAEPRPRRPGSGAPI